jgi:hypothetical protein
LCFLPAHEELTMPPATRAFKLEGGPLKGATPALPHPDGTQPPMLYLVDADNNLVPANVPREGDTGYWLRWVPDKDGKPRYLWSVGWPSEL